MCAECLGNAIFARPPMCFNRSYACSTSLAKHIGGTTLTGASMKCDDVVIGRRAKFLSIESEGATHKSERAGDNRATLGRQTPYFLGKPIKILLVIVAADWNKIVGQ